MQSGTHSRFAVRLKVGSTTQRFSELWQREHGSGKRTWPSHLNCFPRIQRDVNKAMFTPYLHLAAIDARRRFLLPSEHCSFDCYHGTILQRSPEWQSSSCWQLFEEYGASKAPIWRG